MTQQITLSVNKNEAVSGLMFVPQHPRACFVLAHGAGAGMTHPFMDAVASGLGHRGIATLRYQFPYMDKGRRRPDPPSLAHATVRAAAAEARLRLPAVPLFAGGKSFGGRMTSQAQAASPIPGVHGLAFLAFPLHPSGKPSVTRAEHLFSVQIPMLFVQGTRDALAETDYMRQVASQLGARASLAMISDADHSFHVLARSGRTDTQVMIEILDRLTAWMDAAIAGPDGQRRK